MGLATAIQFLNSCNMQFFENTMKGNNGLQYYHITYRSTITLSSVPTTCTICVGTLISSWQVRWIMFVMSDHFFLFCRFWGKLTDRVCDTFTIIDFHAYRSQIITCFLPWEIGVDDAAGEKRQVLTCPKTCSKLHIFKHFPRKQIRLSNAVTMPKGVAQ